MQNLTLNQAPQQDTYHTELNLSAKYLNKLPKRTRHFTQVPLQATIHKAGHLAKYLNQLIYSTGTPTEYRSHTVPNTSANYHTGLDTNQLLEPISYHT